MSNRRRVIDRKKRDLAATKRSQRQVSELALNEDEESHLIDLLAQLEGVNLKTAAEIEAIHIANNPKNETQSKKKQKDESSSGSEGSSDEDEDGSSSSESDEETEEDVETVEIKELTTNELNLMTREKYMRRLIRTDRFERKLLRLGEVKSAESIAAKIRKTITTPSKSTTILPTPPTGGMKGTVSRKVEGVLPPQAVSATKATSLLGPTVRVSVDIVKDKLRGKPKLLVFSRTIDMSDMLSQIRGKFNNAGNKFNALCMVPPSLNGKYKEKDLDSFKILDELDMMMLEDDTQLVLVAVDKKKLSYIPKELKDHQLPKAHEAMQKLSTPEVDESGAKAGQEEEKASGETPDAVKKEETAKWSEDWSPPDDPENQYVYTPLVANASRSNEIKYTLYQTQQLIHSSKSNIRRDPNKVQDGGERDEGDDDELYTANIKAQRESLPIYAKRDEILQALRDHQVMIVCGETGSGKTTQVAQYVLEEMIHNQLGAQCNIICTEPRRIAAVSVAQRVHEEVYHSYNMYGWNVENSMSSSQTSATSSSSSLVSEASQSSASVKGDESLPVIQPNRHGSYKPELGKGLVGYSVRLDSRASEETRLLYCTTGVLLRKLQSETYLKSVSHIIIDEVHERGVETDFLMTILKQQLANFPHLRIILMSATMQEEKFQAYFNQCPCVYVSGRTFPVTVNYMETIRPLITKAGNNHRPIATKPSNGKFVQSNSKNQDIDENAVPPIFDAEIVADVVSHIIAITSNTNRVIPGAVPTTGVDISVRGEAILVFLSGIHAIEKVQKALRNRTNLRGANIKIHILHSTVPPEQQRRVFKPTSPGEWKIVLATNIAETSITVDDITHVVDSGFMKEQRYNPATGINTLQEVFISRSNGKQRAGRAGRVKPGTCWRLFGEAYYTNGASKLAAAKAASTVSVSTPSTSSSNKGAAVQVSKPVNLPPEAIVQEYSIPEIQRIALEEVILQVLYLRLGRPESFLTQCLSPPVSSVLPT